jgi:hypothetical protein
MHHDEEYCIVTRRSELLGQTRKDFLLNSQTRLASIRATCRCRLGEDQWQRGMRPTWPCAVVPYATLPTSHLPLSLMARWTSHQAAPGWVGLAPATGVTRRAAG